MPANAGTQTSLNLAPPQKNKIKKSHFTVE